MKLSDKADGLIAKTVGHKQERERINAQIELESYVAQLEEELASRTETLDAIKEGKSAEYWRTLFYHQQDLQKDVEAENAALKRGLFQIRKLTRYDRDLTEIFAIADALLTEDHDDRR